MRNAKPPTEQKTCRDFVPRGRNELSADHDEQSADVAPNLRAGLDVDDLDTGLDARERLLFRDALHIQDRTVDVAAVLVPGLLEVGCFLLPALDELVAVVDDGCRAEPLEAARA